jgi:hypothetical protein
MSLRDAQCNDKNINKYFSTMTFKENIVENLKKPAGISIT